MDRVFLRIYIHHSIKVPDDRERETPHPFVGALMRFCRAITLESGKRIRYTGLDAPRTVHSERPAGPWEKNSVLKTGRSWKTTLLNQ
jgi:hypothetical protein